MKPEQKCNECGRAIPPDAEYCPRCLLELGLEAGEEDGEQRTGNRSEEPGDRIGRYELLQPLGEGAVGGVWMAEQTEPVRRRVALKVVKLGMDSKEVLARFEAERQALALMDHPNIAKVLDAGTTHSGRPYFVMELVKGIPLIKFCDQQRLSVRERLDLFKQVCQGVQHAHQKGIIHRDLKPSNVLVALYDGKPVPKVIDFGVAKATGQRLTDRTLYTQLGTMIGTLEYMSPEQAELNQFDIDTRGDIYSLGALLYELLTGTTPLEKLRQGGLEEALRRIREEEPPKPSVRLAQAPERLQAISAQRAAEPEKLIRLVRGDLDWIVMMALEKEPERRYETANAFAVEIDNHLNHRPVRPGPPTAHYRVTKFVRRHRSAVLGAAVFIALLAVASVVSTGLAMRARSSEARARLALEGKTWALGVLRTEVSNRLDALWRIQDKGSQTISSDVLAALLGNHRTGIQMGTNLIFSVYTHQEPVTMLNMMAPVLAELERSMTRGPDQPVRIDLRIYRTYAEAQDALAGGERCFSRIGPASYVEIRKRGPGVSLLLAQNGLLRGYIVANNNAGVRSLTDLKGKTFAFVDDSSTLGYHLPRLKLFQAGLTARDLRGGGSNFLGSHSAVIEAVADGKYDAGALNASVLDRVLRQNPSLSNKVHIVNEFGGSNTPTEPWSKTPAQAWVASRMLPAPVANSIRAGLLSIRDTKILQDLGSDSTGFAEARPEDYNELEQAMAKAKDFDR